MRHVYETCAAKYCRNKIKVCGTTVHYIPSIQDSNYWGWVVCKPCELHGRQGKVTDFSRYPVIGRDLEGNLIILQEGIESGGEDDELPQSQTRLETALAKLSVNDGDQQGSSSSQAADTTPSSVEVAAYYKKDLVCFMYQDKEVKTKPDRWFQYDAGNMYYIFDSKDYGLRLYTFEWPEQEVRGKGKKKK